MALFWANDRSILELDLRRSHRGNGLGVSGRSHRLTNGHDECATERLHSRVANWRCRPEATACDHRRKASATDGRSVTVVCPQDGSLAGSWTPRGAGEPSPPAYQGCRRRQHARRRSWREIGVHPAAQAECRSTGAVTHLVRNLMKMHRIKASIVVGMLALAAAPTSAQEAVQVPTTGDIKATLALRGDVQRGKEAYAECQSCHRRDASGRASGGIPTAVGSACVGADQAGDGYPQCARINPEMKDYVVDPMLTLQHFADIAADLRSPPVAGNIGRGPGELVAGGKDLFAKDCSSCHGEQGEGRAELFEPMVASQHYGYLVRELKAIREGSRGNSAESGDGRNPEDLFPRPPTGRRGLHGTAAAARAALSRPAPRAPQSSGRWQPSTRLCPTLQSPHRGAEQGGRATDSSFGEPRAQASSEAAIWAVPQSVFAADSQRAFRTMAPSQIKPAEAANLASAATWTPPKFETRRPRTAGERAQVLSASGACNGIAVRACSAAAAMGGVVSCQVAMAYPKSRASQSELRRGWPWRGSGDCFASYGLCAGFHPRAGGAFQEIITNHESLRHRRPFRHGQDHAAGAAGARTPRAGRRCR